MHFISRSWKTTTGKAPTACNWPWSLEITPFKDQGYLTRIFVCSAYATVMQLSGGYICAMAGVGWNSEQAEISRSTWIFQEFLYISKKFRFPLSKIISWSGIKAYIDKFVGIPLKYHFIEQRKTDIKYTNTISVFSPQYSYLILSIPKLSSWKAFAHYVYRFGKGVCVKLICLNTFLTTKCRIEYLYSFNCSQCFGFHIVH